jgi:hypothetical protein
MPPSYGEVIQKSFRDRLPTVDELAAACCDYTLKLWI